MTDTKLRTTDKIVGNVSPDFNYRKQFTIQSVGQPFLDYLEHAALVVEVNPL